MIEQIKALGKKFGFSDLGICDLDLSEAGEKLNQWLSLGYQGSMEYMARHGDLRVHPEKLFPEAQSVIVVRMDYLIENPDWEVLNNPELGFVSRYAQNRDYHKLIRSRLKKFAEELKKNYGEFTYRVTTDSAPIMEKPLAVKAGLGWIGKHTNLINSQAGSYFFLGCLICSLNFLKIINQNNLAHSKSQSQSQSQSKSQSKSKSKSHCGSCIQCLNICPTQAIIGPYQLDARRCISYLTIENKGPIPMEFRKPMGNRIYGCDDCQIICPWNKFAKPTSELDFKSLRNLSAPKLLDLFSWSEQVFLKNTEGSAIRRIGYQSWIRNIAVALGNGVKTSEVLKALEEKLKDPNISEMVKEHIHWAMYAKI